MGAANGGIRRVTGGGDLGGILEGEEIVRVPDPDVGLGVTLDFTVSFSFSLPSPAARWFGGVVFGAVAWAVASAGASPVAAVGCGQPGCGGRVEAPARW